MFHFSPVDETVSSMLTICADMMLVRKPLDKCLPKVLTLPIMLADSGRF